MFNIIKFSEMRLLLKKRKIPLYEGEFVKMEKSPVQSPANFESYFITKTFKNENE